MRAAGGFLQRSGREAEPVRAAAQLLVRQSAGRGSQAEHRPRRGRRLSRAPARRAHNAPRGQECEGRRVQTPYALTVEGPCFPDLSL